MSTKSKGSRPPIRLVDGGGAKPARPQPPKRDPNAPKRPTRPAYFTTSQRRIFKAICERLERAGHLSEDQAGDIVALTIAEDNLHAYVRFLNANGETYTVTKTGRPYKCPACGGSGLRPMPKGHGPTLNPACPETVPPLSRTKQCSVCTHKERAAIEEALSTRTPLRKVSGQFGTSKSALERHAREHLDMAKRPPGADGPPCKGCKGTGVIQAAENVMVVNYPEVAKRARAIDQVRQLSDRLGLDPVSAVRIHGKLEKKQGGSSRLQELLKRHASR